MLNRFFIQRFSSLCWPKYFYSLPIADCRLPIANCRSPIAVLLSDICGKQGNNANSDQWNGKDRKINVQETY